MVRMYKANKQGQNGEIVIVTDSVDVRDFIPDITDATIQALRRFEGDEEFTLHSIFERAFEIAFKLQGYKTDRVVEERVLRCGYASIENIPIIADTSRIEGKDAP